jgi:hypothetical protein
MNLQRSPKFSGSRSVASRNRLPRILATNVASVTTMGTQNPALGRSNSLRYHRTGRSCYRELPRKTLLLLRTPLNKGKKRKGRGYTAPSNLRCASFVEEK